MTSPGFSFVTGLVQNLPTSIFVLSLYWFDSTRNPKPETRNPKPETRIQLRFLAVDEYLCTPYTPTLHPNPPRYVSSLLLIDEYLVSASFDRTVALWNVRRREVRPTIRSTAVSGFGSRISGLGFQVSGLGSRVSGLGFERQRRGPNALCCLFVTHAVERICC